MSALTREHIEQALPSIKPGKILDLSDAHLIRETMRIALASLEAEPVAWLYSASFERGHVEGELTDAPGCDMPVYAAPPAPVSVPNEQHSERFDWTYGQWAEHLGGRHQNNDPANYYEFGSFMAVAEMLRQFGNVQRKVGWNAYRTAMLQGYVENDCGK